MRGNTNRFRGVRRLLGVALGTTLAVGALAPPAMGVAPTAAPLAITPADGETVTSNPVLHWSAVTGAQKYRVQVSKSSSFDTLLWSASGDTYNRKATVPTNLPVGTIFWRVAATDGASGVGPFATYSFNRQWSDAPALMAPPDEAVLEYPAQTVLLRWNPLPGAATYRIEVDDAADFEGSTTYTTSSTAYTLLTPQVVDQPFYWRAKAVTATIESEWSTPRSYSTRWDAVPQLVGPANQTAEPIQDVVLDWEPVAGAATYELQISPDDDFSSVIPIANSGIMKGTRYSPAITLANGAYYWRVRARDAKSPANEGGWSDTWTFERGWLADQRPTLVEPVDGDVNVSNPSFSWTPVKHASSYLIQIGTDENFSPTTFTQCVTNQTSFTHYVRDNKDKGVPTQTPQSPACSGFPLLKLGRLYYWRVQALDNPKTNDMLEGLWSDTHEFVYQIPSPTPLTPADGATVSTPVLSWEPVLGTGRYKVVINKASGLVASQAETYATSFTPPEDLNPLDGPFTWYVISISNHGNSSVPSFAARRSFNLVDPASPGSTPTVITPAAVAAGTPRMPSMTWEPVADAHHYRVFYKVASAPENTWTAFPPEIHQAGYTYNGTTLVPTLSPGNYEWYVQAETIGDVPVSPMAVGAPSTFTITAADVPAEAYRSPEECLVGESCAIGDTPRLTWDVQPNAGSYYVYVASDPNFTTLVGRYWTPHTTLTPRESYVDSQAGQSYYWLVRPCIEPNYPAARCGPYDTTVFPQAPAFRKQSPAAVPLSPANGAVVANEITFEWEDYLATNEDATPPSQQEAQQYQIQVSTEPDFSPLLDTALVDQTTYTPHGKTYPNGPIYWRVQARDNSLNLLTQSPTQSLTKTSPPVTPLNPEPGEVISGLPTMRWEPRLFAASYDVQLFRTADPGFSETNRVFTQNTKLTAFAPTTNLPAGVYTWRVRPVDVDLRPGAWADGGSFTLSPSVVQLVTPSVGATVSTHTLLFTWSSTATAVQYRFQASTSSGFNSIFEQQVVAAPAWAPTRLYPDDEYWWRVQALDGANNVLSTSVVRKFTKQEAMKTALTLERSVTVLSDPDTVQLRGQLTRTDTGQDLEFKGVNLWGRKLTSATMQLLGSGQTDRNGYVSFTHAPKQHWAYQLRYPTDGVVTGSNSPTRKVLFKPRLTGALEDNGLMQGDGTRMLGTISPHYKGRTIYLEKHISGVWKRVASKTLGAPSANPPVIKFALKVAPKKRKVHYYRVVFPARTNVHLRAATPKLPLTIY